MEKFSEQEKYNHAKGQIIMADMLKEFVQICIDNDIYYWCVGGTLIGAVRHRGWIPHDADIDVAMLEKDYNKLQPIIQKKLSSRYWFQDKTTDVHYTDDWGKIRYLDAYYCDYKPQNWHNGISIDIFVFKEENNKIIPLADDYEFTILNKSVIFPLKKLSFEGISVYVPNQYKKYCTDVWGDYPPSELPLADQYPHEGRISFIIPIWMKEKYHTLYR